MQEEGQPQLPRRVALQSLLNGNKVLEGLGHLAAGDGEVAGVQEEGHPVVRAVPRLREGGRGGGRREREGKETEDDEGANDDP